MRLSFVALGVGACLTTPVEGQERHPTVQKVVEIAVMNHVVRAKCPGWSVNPSLIALAVMAVGFSGQQAQLDSVKEDDVFALAESAKKNSLIDSVACDNLLSHTIDNPLEAGKSIPVFIKGN